MQLSIIKPGFVAGVEGLDVTRDVSRADADAIEATLQEYPVLVLRNQFFYNDDQQLDFTRLLGRFNASHDTAARKRNNIRLKDGLTDVSNLTQENTLRRADDHRRLTALANRLWHSDASFQATPARYSMLSARNVPSSGGDTEFADMRAAYDALDEATRQRVDPLVTEHSAWYSRRSIGVGLEEFGVSNAKEADEHRAVRHRLVRSHPVTGRKSLFLSAYIGSITGWLVPEAQMFIRDLTEHATQREFVYAHQWRNGDFVLWDNRFTMHRGRAFDETQVRDLRRSTTIDVGPTVDQNAVVAA